MKKEWIKLTILALALGSQLTSCGKSQSSSQEETSETPEGYSGYSAPNTPPRQGSGGRSRVGG